MSNKKTRGKEVDVLTANNNEANRVETQIVHFAGAPNDNFQKNICSEDDLRSRIFETFVVKLLACLPLLGFSKI